MPKNREGPRHEGSLTSEPASEIVGDLVLKFVDSVGVGSADFRELKKSQLRLERLVHPINR